MDWLTSSWFGKVLWVSWALVAIVVVWVIAVQVRHTSATQEIRTHKFYADMSRGVKFIRCGRTWINVQHIVGIRPGIDGLTEKSTEISTIDRESYMVDESVEEILDRITER